MDTLLSRTTPEQRRDLFTQTATRMNINERLIEKDFWVCWMLRRLFTIPEAGSHLTFKGGTSLSKAFALTSRFSEDIDLIIERSWLGQPDAPSGSPRQWLNKIKDACRRVVRDQIFPALQKDMAARLTGETWDLLTTQKGDEDPRELIFQYPTVFSPEVKGYVRTEVKMEFNARSDAEPSLNASIRSYAAQEFPANIPDENVILRCLAPERTFWEKATLLHEELCHPEKDRVRQRLSRHFYDLARMISAGVSERALNDVALYERVVKHRADFFPNSWMDYSSLLQGPLILTPSTEQLAHWKRDYAAMSVMIFDSPPSFESVIASTTVFASRFNQARGVAT